MPYFTDFPEETGEKVRIELTGTRVVRYFCTLPTKIANPRTRPRSRFQLSIII